MEHDLVQHPEPDEESQGATSSGEKKFPIRPKFSPVDVTPDERTMAALAHGSIILTLLTGGFGGLIVAFVVWAVHREKSRWVANQALQALIFQIVATLIAYVLGLLAAGAILISSILVAILIGLCLLPFALLLGLVAFIFPIAATAYGIFGAVETYQGRDFQYWWVGDLVREKERG